MRDAVWAAIALAALGALPLLLTNPYARHVVLVALVFAFVALGLNVVFGYAGQHAFGHPVLFGVGAYGSALLAVRAGWPVPAALAGGVAVTAAIALAVAYPSFRLRGIYFGVVTFAFARVIYLLAENWIGLTRGPMGIPSVPPIDLVPAAWLPGTSREVRLHVGVVLLLAVTLVVLHRVVASSVGRAWIAIRENEELAASLGIPPLRYKLSAFTAGGALAGIGGGLYAHYVSFVGPTELGFHYIGIVFIMTIAGGTGTLVGPVIGALVFGVLPEVLRVAESARNLLLGTILLLTIAVLPEGLVGLWARFAPVLARGRGRRRATTTATDVAGVSAAVANVRGRRRDDVGHPATTSADAAVTATEVAMPSAAASDASRSREESRDRTDRADVASDATTVGQGECDTSVDRPATTIADVQVVARDRRSVDEGGGAAVGRGTVSPAGGALEIRGVTKRFGGLVVLRDVSFRVEPGSIVGLIGPNGAGKTTLFNIVAGVLPPTSGDVLYGSVPITGRAPAAIARLGISRSFQITSLFPDLSVADNVRAATHAWGRTSVWSSLLRSRAFRRREAEVERVVDESLDLVRLGPLRAAQARALSYGAQRGLELALTLATRARLVLLDEPAAGLTAEESEHLRTLILDLRARGLTVLLIEHDMRLVMGLCDRIVVLNYGEKIGEGSPQDVAADARVVEAYLGSERVRA